MAHMVLHHVQHVQLVLEAHVELVVDAVFSVTVVAT